MTSQPTAPVETSEASQIHALLQGQKKGWPASVARCVADWRVETGEDHLDDPAIWVWVILEDSIWGCLEDDAKSDQRDEIRKRVRACIAVPKDGWVYVFFRTKTEQEELDSGEDEDEEESE